MSASHYRIKGASPQVRVFEVRQSLFNNFVDVRCSLKGRFPRKLLISKAHENMVFLGETYDVSPYHSQRSHPSMDLGVKWDLCVLFVQTAVKCQDC